MIEAGCRILCDEDREDRLQLLPVRAVARNCSFRSEKVFILSITSSLVRLTRGGRLNFVSGGFLFFMVPLSTKIKACQCYHVSRFAQIVPDRYANVLCFLCLFAASIISSA